LKCLDTDLLVAILRHHEKAAKRIEQLDQQGRQSTTAVNAFELFYGATKSRMVEENTKEVHKLLSRLEVLPMSLGSAEKAGSIFGVLELKGIPIDLRDAMIAGISMEHKQALVTRNTRDYNRIPGLALEEW
jgi:predicted nucleic acid-binding protein